MVKDDIRLIRRVLSGDDEAFTALVRKHQESVHALAWRRVGDFHFAEEITQDAFLRAYRGLPKLKDPGQFSGWLYVITNRLCNNWLEKNKSAITLLEDTPVVEVQRTAYERYVSEQHEKKGQAHREEVVRKLLAKLPESERTVMILHYLGEMTAKEIGNFLGVSMNTITSRLQRARKRLQQHEELLVQEMLGSVQLSDTLTDIIARKVADVKLTPPPNAKPFLPWMAFGVASVLVVLLLSASNQYLVRLQKPYSFQAQSEPTVEIIDTAITLNIDSKPAVRNQAGKVTTPSENSGGVGLESSPNLLLSNQQVNSRRRSISQWTQSNGPQAGQVLDLFATSEGILYAATPTGIYRMMLDESAWNLVNTNIPVSESSMPIAEYDGTLYIVSTDEVFASVDRGETWKGLGNRPKGEAIDLIITDVAQRVNSEINIVMYLALQNKGIFCSIDAGAQWYPLNNGLASKRISAVAAIGNTVFAGTNEGLYRLISDTWARLPVEASNAVHSLAVTKDNLYLGTGPDISTLSKEAEQIANVDDLSVSKAFHSNDLGKSWTEITPISKPPLLRPPTGMKISAVGQSLLIQDFEQFRSRDGGQTWINLGFDASPFTLNSFQAVAVNENIFYKVDAFGIHRTTDSGTSWYPFMEGIVGTGMRDLVAFDGKLYVYTGKDVVQSTNGGESWENILVVPHEHTFGLIGKGHARINFPFDSQLAVTDGGFYVIVPETDNLRILTLSTVNNLLNPVPGVPAFDSETQPDELTTMLRSPKISTKAGGFAVDSETFYIEYKRKLFKWRPGDSKWAYTGLLDTSENLGNEPDTGFKLAASAKTVYVGKRAGRLFQSLDEGNSWKDVTPTLPVRFTRFNEIVFADSTAYVATDQGVMASQNGEPWRVLADGTGRRIVVDRLAVDGTMVYGAGDKGVYRLDTRGHWKQISPNVPGQVISLVVNRDRLYIATERRGMFHISLAEEDYSLSRK